MTVITTGAFVSLRTRCGCCHRRRAPRLERLRLALAVVDGRHAREHRNRRMPAWACQPLSRPGSYTCVTRDTSQARPVMACGIGGRSGGDGIRAAHRSWIVAQRADQHDGGDAEQ
ncbi:MAG: hypothetical protein LC749_04855 [Actinobacteria bacterium]|nr:hypothetical protein [Actinomycetota bacterium]